MGAGLSPELRALCEWASHEPDPQKSPSELTKFSKARAEDAGKGNSAAANVAKRVTFTNCVTDLLAQADPALRDDERIAGIVWVVAHGRWQAKPAGMQIDPLP